MKMKLVGLLIALLFMANVLGLIPVPAAKAHTKSEPFTTNLIAGKNIDVGDVLVWNDENYLYVKYVTTGDWYISEVHLEVATSLAGIPQAKGNPIPGKFTYGEQGLWTTEYSFPPIPLTWDKGTELYIAAHAKVWEAASLTTMTVVSREGVTVYGPSSSYLPLGDSEWGLAGSAVATWVHPYWPSITGATWISTAYYVENPVGDSWRWFHDEFVVLGYPAEGTVVLATSDNAEEVYFNGELIGSDGEVQGPFVDNYEWGTVLSYAIDPQMGTNTLDFIVRNYAQSGGTVESNPTGLIYKANVSYYTRCETAWGAGLAFPGKNWATYFTYTVQGWTLVDTVTVDSADVDGTDSNIILATDKQYKFVVTGSYWRNKGGSPNQLCDAEYTSYDSYDSYTAWSEVHDGCLDYTTGWLASWTWLGADFGDLQVNGAFVHWGPFSTDHKYTLVFGLGTGSTVNFRIYDGDLSGPISGWYNDNQGSLTVEIYVWE